MLMCRPFIIEFLGTPEAGKTTAINGIVTRLEARNMKVCYIHETAELDPGVFAKGSFDAQIWMLLKRFELLQEALYGDYEMIIMDRGAFDGAFWVSSEYENQEVDPGIKDLMLRLCKYSLWQSDFLVALVCNPEMSVYRRGGEGRIVTMKWLEAFNKKFYEYFLTTPAPGASKIVLDTTNWPKDDVIDFLTNIVIRGYDNYKSS